MSWRMGGHWDPFRELERQVGQIIGSIDPFPGRSFRPIPPVNLFDAGDRYILKAEVPGVSAENVDLSLTGETLTMRGERCRPEGLSDERFRRQERVFGRWSRNITFPERVNASAVSAECVDGILTVVLPKAEESAPRQIAVSSFRSSDDQPRDPRERP